MILSQVTGGADGGINLWPLYIYNTNPNLLPFHGNLFGEDCASTEGQNQNCPRRTGLTSKGNTVAVTDSGCLLFCTVLGGGQGNWRLVDHEKSWQAIAFWKCPLADSLWPLLVWMVMFFFLKVNMSIIS